MRIISTGSTHSHQELCQTSSSTHPFSTHPMLVSTKAKWRCLQLSNGRSHHKYATQMGHETHYASLCSWPVEQEEKRKPFGKVFGQNSACRSPVREENFKHGQEGSRERSVVSENLILKDAESLIQGTAINYWNHLKWKECAHKRNSSKCIRNDMI